MWWSRSLPANPPPREKRPLDRAQMAITMETHTFIHQRWACSSHILCLVIKIRNTDWIIIFFSSLNNTIFRGLFSKVMMYSLQHESWCDHLWICSRMENSCFNQAQFLLRSNHWMFFVARCMIFGQILPLKSRQLFACDLKSGVFERDVFASSPFSGIVTKNSQRQSSVSVRNSLKFK